MMDRPLAVVIAGLDGRDIQPCQLKAGENLSVQIMALSPDRWGGSSIYVFRNSLAADNEIPSDDVPTIIVQPDDFYLVRATPAKQAVVPILATAAVAAVAFLTFGAGAALLVGSTALAGYLASGLIPRPQQPTAETARDQASGLNSLGPPHNLARIGSRIPEIFGLMRIYPDIAIPAIEVWSGRNQSVDALYAIGVGTYIINNFKLGETPISGLPGVVVTQFGPNHTMPAYPVVRSVDSQQQIDLPPPASGPVYSPTPYIDAIGDHCVGVWVDIGFPSGLVIYRSSGGTRSETTSVRFEYQRIDIAGQPVLSFNHTFTAANGNPLRYTVKIEPLTAGRYRVRAFRLDSGTTSVNDTHVSGCVLIKVAGVENLPASSRLTGRVTFVQLSIDNNDQVAQLSSLTFNHLAQRVLRTIQTAGIPSVSAVATRNMIDALYYTMTEPTLGGMTNADLDLAGWWNVHVKLRNIDGGQAALFNGVFDRFNKVDDMAQAIAQIGRCSAVYDGGRIILMRDEDKPAPVSVFNRRVRPADDQSTRVLSFFIPDEEDGISIDWKDNDNFFVSRNYTYPSNSLNPKKLDFVGATLWSQIYRRAIYEYLRMKYRRRTYKVQTFEEGLICNPLDIVTVIDPWIDQIADGDLISYDAGMLTVVVDQPLRPNAGDVLRIRDIYGSVTDDVPLYPESRQTTKLRLMRAPLITVGGRSPDSQVGSLYVLGSPAFMSVHDWHVMDVSTSNRDIVELNLVEYAPVVFTCDTVALPAPPPLQ